jgi:hypothetical protein
VRAAIRRDSVCVVLPTSITHARRRCIPIWVWDYAASWTFEGGPPCYVLVKRGLRWTLSRGSVFGGFCLGPLVKKVRSRWRTTLLKVPAQRDISLHCLAAVVSR